MGISILYSEHAFYVRRMDLWEVCWRMEADGGGSGSCQMTSLVISGVGTLGSATLVLVRTYCWLNELDILTSIRVARQSLSSTGCGGGETDMMCL
jgi:hypothetical protein